MMKKKLNNTQIDAVLAAEGYRRNASLFWYECDDKKEHVITDEELETMQFTTTATLQDFAQRRKYQPREGNYGT